MKALKAITIIIFALLVSSCTKNFEDINKNPNYPAETDPNYLFNYVIKEGAGEFAGQGSSRIYTYYNRVYVQRWIMHTSVIYGNSTMPPYTLFGQSYIKNMWEYFYSDLMLNCKMLEKATQENEDDLTKYQVARIWSVYNFHKITDLWGDVPFLDAWQLLEDFSVNSIKPEYDTQEDIYAEMISILKDAVVKLDSGLPFFENDDLFGGDLEKWTKFANSLMLRLAVRSRDGETVNELIAGNMLMSSNEESALFTYIDAQDWWNPYYQLNEQSRDASNPHLTGKSVPKLSWMLYDIFLNTNDPRLDVYAQPIEIDDISYFGCPNLVNSTLKENQAMYLISTNTSYIGRYFSEDPVWTKQVLSYAEVCFLRAEAALNLSTGDDARQWYENGVRATMEHYDIDTSLVNDYLIAGGAYNGTLEQILTQKWIALFLDGWEAFTEYRRTGFPQLMKWDLELNGTQIISSEYVEVLRTYVPGRLPYPMDEADLNGDNYNTAVERQGGDLYKQQLWYSVAWEDVYGALDYEGEY